MFAVMRFSVKQKWAYGTSILETLYKPLRRQLLIKYCFTLQRNFIIFGLDVLCVVF